MDYELIKPDADDAYDPAPFLSYARRRAAELAERDPVVGDHVHYWDGERCVAAMVTELDWDASPTIIAMPVWLTIFPSRGQLPGATVDPVSYDGGKAAGNTWHWPERS